eukprot:4258-Eustigmatos_ZCMA.PRE.1
MYLKKTEALESIQDIPVGSFVRVAMYSRSNPFNKLTPNYSKELYEVEKYDESKNRYKLKGLKGLYEYWKLQVVDKQNLMKHNISRYVDTTISDD